MIFSISLSIYISPGQGCGETARRLSIIDKSFSTEDPQKTPMHVDIDIDK
jgi:hypothetical protein